MNEILMQEIPSLNPRKRIFTCALNSSTCALNPELRLDALLCEAFLGMAGVILVAAPAEGRVFEAGGTGKQRIQLA